MLLQVVKLLCKNNAESWYAHSRLNAVKMSLSPTKCTWVSKRKGQDDDKRNRIGVNNVYLEAKLYYMYLPHVMFELFHSEMIFGYQSVGI